MSENQKKARHTLIKKNKTIVKNTPPIHDESSIHKKIKIKLKPSQTITAKEKGSRIISQTQVDTSILETKPAIAKHPTPNITKQVQVQVPEKEKELPASTNKTFNNDKTAKQNKESTPITSRVYTKERPKSRPNTTYTNRAGTHAKPQSSQNTPYTKEPHTAHKPKPHFTDTNTQPTKRTYKSTKKRQFVNKRKQFEEKQLVIDGNKKKKSTTTVITNPVPKSISILESISVVDLAKKMNLKSSELLGRLMTMGTMANLNSVVDYETAQILASEYDCEIKVISLFEQTLIDTEDQSEKEIVNRPPIVTIMGHVNHGKTTLLDTIRKSNVSEEEQGSITQHIGSYMVETNLGKITFLDTPGHEAFTQMRSRGVQITDLILLVVAADDGINTQSKEVISLAKKDAIPVIVVMNKMDAPNANPDKILQQLAEIDLVPSEWGGDTEVCKISALRNEGIEQLLEQIILQAELMEIHADIGTSANGVVLESKIEQGRGIVITVLIKNGILRRGQSFVSGIYNGKVRDIINDNNQSIELASPSMPVHITGINDMPNAGDPFQVTTNEKMAKQYATRRQELMRHQASQNVKKVTSDTLYDTIKQENTKILHLIIKGDVHGSVEALKDALEKLSNEEIRVKVILASSGSINAADIKLAATSNATIIAFNVRPNQQVQSLASQERVKIHRYDVIFDVIDNIKLQIEDMRSPVFKEEKTGEATIRQIFTHPRVGTIAGSYVVDGKVERDTLVKVMRNDVEIFTGKISSLKRVKEDVNKVNAGYECGIGIENATDLQEGDVLLIYKQVLVPRHSRA